MIYFYRFFQYLNAALVGFGICGLIMGGKWTLWVTIFIGVSTLLSTAHSESEQRIKQARARRTTGKW